MTRSVSHRGPDHQDTIAVGAGALGAARLRIVGGMEADQPLRGERGSLLAWNGEIFNYRQLLSSAGRSTSDSLVLHSLLERDRERCLNQLRGPFALAHLAADGQSILLARDEFGQKPLFFHEGKKGVVFASEVRALFAAGAPRALNEAALDDYRTLQFYSPGRTLFAGVRCVLPGSWIRFELTPSGVGQVASGSFRFDSTGAETADSSDETRRLLEESCRLQLSHGVPAGITLSGGLDSTAVTAALMAQGQDSLRAYVGFPTDAPELDERRWARMAAQKCGIPLHEVPISGSDVAAILPEVVRTLEMPVAGPGSVAQFLVAREAAKDCRVLFGGQGGDEVFGGYERLRLLGAIDAGATESPNPLYQPLMDRMQEAGSGMMPYFAAIHRGSPSTDVLRRLARRLSPEGPGARDDLDPVDQAAHIEMQLQLPGLLHVDDRVTAHFGMEGRSPLLDQRLVAHVSGIPMRDRSPWSAPRAHFLSAFKRYLPEAIAERPDKMGFPLPLDRWLRSDLRDLVGDVFTSQKARERGYLSRHDLTRLSDNRATEAREVFGYLMLELWHQEYLDCSEADSIQTIAQGIA